MSGEINPFDPGRAESTFHVLFTALVDERKRINSIIDRARNKNPDDPRLERAQSCGSIIDRRLEMWLDRWQPPEPPH